MTATIKIDSAGRFVLPKSFRERLHLAPGAKLKAEVVADKIELTPEPDEGVKVICKGKRLVLAKKGMPFDAAAAIRSERETMETIGTRR